MCIAATHKEERKKEKSKDMRATVYNRNGRNSNSTCDLTEKKREKALALASAVEKGIILNSV